MWHYTCRFNQWLILIVSVVNIIQHYSISFVVCYQLTEFAVNSDVWQQLSQAKKRQRITNLSKSKTNYKKYEFIFLTISTNWSAENIFQIWIFLHDLNYWIDQLGKITKLWDGGHLLEMSTKELILSIAPFTPQSRFVPRNTTFPHHY